MDKLAFELKNLASRNRDGSKTTQANRIKQLSLFARQLKQLGYRDLSATSLKTKHVQALVNHWQSDKSAETGELVSAGTIKNRLANIRWWASKVNKANVVPRSNKDLGIADRQRLPSYNKAFSLDGKDLSSMPSHLRYSLKLQESFGLRREEAAKIVVTVADQGDKLVLKSSWTKGGRAREIPVLNKDQRLLLDAIKSEFGNNSLIPSDYSYKRYLSLREYLLNVHDLKNTHGLRHQYAQVRYSEISGLTPPRLGGPRFRDLSPADRERDLRARYIVSEELGHSRIDITRVYLG